MPHSACSWLLEEVNEYVGWEELMVLAVGWPDTSVISPHGRYFRISAATLEWLAAAQRAVASRVLRGELAALRAAVRWGVWARYGMVNGDLMNDELDERGRASGTEINRRWRRLRPRLLAEVPTLDRLLAARREVERAICRRGLSAGQMTPSSFTIY